MTKETFSLLSLQLQIKICTELSRAQHVRFF